MVEIVEASQKHCRQCECPYQEIWIPHTTALGFAVDLVDAKAVVFPSTLVEQWKVLQVAVDAGCAIIMQAAKTGLDWRFISKWL